MSWFAPPVIHPDYVAREYRLVDTGTNKYYLEYKDPGGEWERHVEAYSYEYGIHRWDWKGSERKARRKVDKMARKHYNQWLKERTKGKIINLGRVP